MVLGGDFNVSPDTLMDTSHGRPTNSQAFLKHFQKSLQNNFFIDTWRALQASDRDYSYYSGVHDVYTCIALMCVDHATLELLQSAEMGNITILDHAPVLAMIKVPVFLEQCGQMVTLEV